MKREKRRTRKKVEKKADIKGPTLEELAKRSPPENNWANLLTAFKVIRDAVHGDTWVTEFETKIIDEKVFQRLRGIRQLGPTYFVYPCAHHTRFEHCLGTLYMAQEIINAVQRNFKNKSLMFKKDSTEFYDNGFHMFSLSDRDIVLIRVVALLHDGAHVPFGHILEKEGNVLTKTQWADKERVKCFFETHGMRKVIESHLQKVVGQKDAKEFLEDLKKALGAIEGVDPESGEIIQEEFPEDRAVGKLKCPYIGDIVGNTICADLLDYLLRDSYFAGLRLSQEVRLISNFAIIGKSRKEARLTLLLVRKGRLRLDTLSEAVELLRQRYFLAERAYYHRVKTCASAMIINALYVHLRGFDKQARIDYLMKFGDDELVRDLCQLDETKASTAEEIRETQLVKNTIERFRGRKLYSPVYMIYSRTEGKESNRIKELIRRFTDPEERYKFQDYIEKLLDIDHGSVIIYVTKKDVGKAARTRCLWTDGDVKPLENIGKTRTLLRSELETLKKKYEELWRLYVFLKRDLVDEWGKYVVGFCKRRLIEMNDVENEELSKAKALEESEIFLDVGIPITTGVSKEQRLEFTKKVISLKARNGDFQKLGIPREELNRVFSELMSETQQTSKDDAKN